MGGFEDLHALRHPLARSPDGRVRGDGCRAALHLLPPNAEDYRWWWRSYLSGASVSLFFLAFCVYYYFSTNMSGVLQTSFFFLYSGLAAYAVSLVMGSLGFLAAMRFVFYIYSQIKSE